MRLPALLALMLLGWTFPALGQDITGSKQILDGVARLDGVPAAVTSTATPRWHAEVMAIYPHDMWAFSEGLELHNGELYESTGGQGYSSLRRVHLATGLVTQAVHMGAQDFGEGLAIADDRLVQLTYKQQVAYVYDRDTLKPIGQYKYTGEGWGLCFDGQHFIMSNGTNELTVRDPVTFAVLSTIAVTVDGQPQKFLNELECVGDLIYANVYGTSSIVEIGRYGVVSKIIDMPDLLTKQDGACLGMGIPHGHDLAVLNGVAYDTSDGSFLVTGKLWPKMFRVKFVPP
jgi:glutaminyl-peptide cyclotransferase